MNVPFFKFKNKIEFNPPINFTIVVLLNLLFFSFYFLFVIFSDSISHFGAHPDIKNLTPWICNSLGENDGIELYVMMLAMPLYLFLGYIISKKTTIKLAFLSTKWTPLLYIFFIGIIFTFHFFITEKPHVKEIIVFIFVSIILSSCAIKLAQQTFTKWTKIVLVIISFFSLSIIGLFINTPPSIFDYGYYIGPASKILAGEKFGSFYMQYNIFGTSLFVLMQKLNLQLHQIFIVFIFIFSFWMFLYSRAATILFQNKSYVYLFLVTLFIVRCLTISVGPVSIPQVSPIRMDLWVPLIIILSRFGFTSTITASAFSICYLGDDVFGFMYLTLYTLTIIIIFLSKYFKQHNGFSFKIILPLLPIILALVIHIIIFKTLTSPSGKIYSDFHIGFLPILKNSSFWFIAWLLPICLYILTINKKNQLLHLFIFGIACVQLTYFFGRSHDHNLLNISGIFVFILFLTLDSLYTHSSKNKYLLYVTILLIAAVNVNYYSPIKDKWAIAIQKIKTHSILEPNPIEKQLAIQGNYLTSFGTDKILIVSDIDSYVNYRLGYRQVGYFSPFCANIFIDQTTTFLTNQLNNGYRLIIYPCACNELEKDIPLLNNSKNKQRFVVNPLKYGLMEITLANN